MFYELIQYSLVTRNLATLKLNLLYISLKIYGEGVGSNTLKHRTIALIITLSKLQ